MDILIRGMKIPKNCDECRIMVFEDTNCAPELYCGCPIVFKAHPQGVDHRPDYCPLIPVQKHGRLGDLDKLVKEVKNMAKEFPPDSVGAERYRLFAEFIKTAPTVIPAEEV